MVKKSLNIIIGILLIFCVLFINIAPASSAFMDENDVGTKKERQLLRKIELIHQSFSKQTDEAALYATLVHRGNFTDYVNDSYDPDWEDHESDYKENWSKFSSDFTQVYNNPLGTLNIPELIRIFISAGFATAECAVEAVTGVFDTSEENVYDDYEGSGPLSIECVWTKVVEYYVTEPTHDSEETVDGKVTDMQSIDLLTAAAIVMIDSSNWIGNYSDENYKKALAGSGLVGNMANNAITKFMGAVFNGVFCTAGFFADVATGGGAVDLATSNFNPTASFTDAVEFGSSALFSTPAQRMSRYYTMARICRDGFIGGTYTSVQDIEDDKIYQGKKDKIAEEIIGLAEKFREMGSSSGDDCIVNPSSSGAFATWKQYDEEWGSLPVGSGGTMSSIGCLVTSVAIQLARSGTAISNLPNGYSSFNPGAFITTLNSNGGIVGGGAFSWTGWDSIASNWKAGDSVSTSISDTATLAKTLSQELSTGAEGQYQKFIVLQIHHNGSSQHWVAVDSVNGDQVTIFDPGAEGTTLDDNYSGWVVDSYRILYATDVMQGQTGSSSSGSLPDYCETSGEIVIPEEFGGGGYTITVYTDFNWAYDQGKVYDIWLASGAKFDDGIAVIDGRYLVAVTTTFGNVGDKVDFFLDDGTKIPAIIADIKSQEVVPWDPNPANEWGHNNGQVVLEFEVDGQYYYSYGNPGSDKWRPEWAGKRVASATNLGESILH